MEKTGDEMFEELGYKKQNVANGYSYYKDCDNVLYFETAYKCVHKSGEYDGMCDYISMEELKAINKKVEELGWNEK